MWKEISGGYESESGPRMSKLGVVLRTVRVQSFMTIGDLSVTSDVPHGLIGKLERGYVPKNCPWFSNLERALSLPHGCLVDLHRRDLDEVVVYSIRDLKIGRAARLEAAIPAKPRRKAKHRLTDVVVGWAQ